MRALSAFLLIAILFQDAHAVERASTASPLIGSWAVDVSRLQIPPQERPKGVTITFVDPGAGKWTTQVDIVDASGAASRATGTATLDGTPAPVAGSTEADTAALKMPTPDVLVMALGKGGVPASTRIYAVAADGKSLVETAVYFGYGGRPIMRTNYFTRVQ